MGQEGLGGEDQQLVGGCGQLLVGFLPLGLSRGLRQGFLCPPRRMGLLFWSDLKIQDVVGELTIVVILEIWSILLLLISDQLLVWSRQRSLDTLRKAQSNLFVQ